MGEWTYKQKGTATHGPISQGDHVKSSRYTPAERGGNGRIVNPDGDDIWLWVSEVTADFQLAGSTAQSVHKREFYARNFVQPRLTVTGQAGDSLQYQMLAEFVRTSQLMAILYGDHESIANPVCTLYISAGPAHKLITVEGYIEAISRGAKRFEAAIDWSFEFIVSRAVDWLMTDEVILGRQLLAWKDFLVKKGPESYAVRKGADYEADPDAAGVLPSGTEGAMNEALKDNKKHDAQVTKERLYAHPNRGQPYGEAQQRRMRGG